jgi:hypothetical protein
MTMFRSIARRLARNEEGWAMLTALTLLVLMMTSSIALAAYMDNETTQTTKTRQRETSFNFAEAALSAQLFALSQSTTSQYGGWPGTQAQGYAPCNESVLSTNAVQVAQCPSQDRLKALFPTPDADPGVTWETRVIDNHGAAATQAALQTPDALSSFYSDALAAQLNAPGWAAGSTGWDANKDGKVWVRAQATIKGRTRKIVALVRQEFQPEDIIQKAIAAGAIDITNNGNKSLIQGGDVTNVAVRCSVNDTSADASAACLGQPYDSSAWKKVDEQIQPFDVNTQQRYGVERAMSDDAIDRLRETAKRVGTYVVDCSTLGSNTPGGIVFAEGGNCNIGGSNTDADDPGMVINLTGTFTVGPGSPVYHGVLYAANRVSVANESQLDTTKRTLVTLQGTPVIFGGVLIDGNGKMYVGSSGGASVANGNIVFDPKAYGAAQSIATAGIIQNTWRELTPR